MTRYGIPVVWAVEGEDADVANVWSGNVVGFD